MASSEKMTDVNIAVELLQDAFQGAFDTAILISADSDLIAPIAAVRRLSGEAHHRCLSAGAVLDRPFQGSECVSEHRSWFDREEPISRGSAHG
ncbi:MAG: NYN domain-containing protein [Bryobacteraceae bacterium]